MALLAPALLPSWRFFDAIEPSPRLQLAAWHGRGDVEPRWHDVSLTPIRSSAGASLRRLLINSTRNDTLFLVSCCSRVLDDGRVHAQREIAIRLSAVGRATGVLVPDGPGLRFRILEVSRRAAGGLDRQVAFTSQPFTLDGVPLSID